MENIFSMAPSDFRVGMFGIQSGSSGFSSLFPTDGRQNDGSNGDQKNNNHVGGVVE